MATPQERLHEAEAAYHDLMIGKSAVQFRDANGEFVMYGKADAAQLAAYIDTLKRQIAGLASGPMYFGG